MGEIKKFAENVIPEARFIFDQYKVSPNSADDPFSKP